MEGHIHLSIISFLVFTSYLLVALFLLHQLSLMLAASPKTVRQQWGQAIGAGFGI